MQDTTVLTLLLRQRQQMVPLEIAAHLVLTVLKARLLLSYVHLAPFLTSLAMKLKETVQNVHQVCVSLCLQAETVALFSFWLVVCSLEHIHCYPFIKLLALKQWNKNIKMQQSSIIKCFPLTACLFVIINCITYDSTLSRLTYIANHISKFSVAP